MDTNGHGTRCSVVDVDGDRCQLQSHHDGLHLAFTNGAVLAWTVPAVEIHRLSAQRIARWVQAAPWATGFRPSPA